MRILTTIFLILIFSGTLQAAITADHTAICEELMKAANQAETPQLRSDTEAKIQLEFSEYTDRGLPIWNFVVGLRSEKARLAATGESFGAADCSKHMSGLLEQLTAGTFVGQNISQMAAQADRPEGVTFFGVKMITACRDDDGLTLNCNTSLFTNFGSPGLNTLESLHLDLSKSPLFRGEGRPLFQRADNPILTGSGMGFGDVLASSIGSKGAFDIVLNKYSDKECSCIKSNYLDDKHEGNQEAMDAEINEEKKELEKFVFKLYGQDFINQYAKNLEDVNYYQVNQKEVFRGGLVGTRRTHHAVAAQCNDVDDFKTAIKASCKGTSLENDKALQDERLNMLLNAFNGPGEKSIEEHLPYLDDKILNVTINEKDENGAVRIFDRDTYDMARKGSMEEIESIKFLDNLVASALGDADIWQAVQDDKGRLEPRQVLTTNLIRRLRENPAKFKSDFVKGNFPGSWEAIEKLTTPEALADNDNFQTLEEHFRKTFLVAMTANPAFRLAMSDFDFLTKTVEKFPSGKSSSVIQIIENGGNRLLSEQFDKQCRQLKEKLAKAVCVEPSAVLQNLDRKGMEELLIKEKADKPDFKGLAFYEAMLCTTPAQTKDEGYLPHLLAGVSTSVNNPFSDSDYLVPEKGFAVASKAPLRVDRIAESGDRSGRNPLKSADRASRRSRDRVAERIIASGGRISEGGKVRSISSTEAAQLAQGAQSGTSDKVLRAPASVEDKGKKDLQDQAGTADVVPGSIPGTADMSTAHVLGPQTERETRSNAEVSADRASIRETLVNGENDEEVDEHLDNLESSDFKELQKLKAEALKDQQKLLELTNQNEELKLQALKDKIRALEEKKAEVQSGQGSTSVSSTAVDMDSGSSSGGRLGDFSADNSADPAQNQAATAGTQSAAGGATARSSLAGGGGAGLLGGGTGVRAGATSGRDLSSAGVSEAGAIIISSGDAFSGQEVGQNELGEQVITFINSAEPDLTVLKQMKEKGVLYKFKVLENGVYVEKEVLVKYDSLSADAKKLLEKKIAEKEEIQSLDQQIAEARRTHSFQALKLILGEELRSRQ